MLFLWFTTKTIVGRGNPKIIQKRITQHMHFFPKQLVYNFTLPTSSSIRMENHTQGNPYIIDLNRTHLYFLCPHQCIHQKGSRASFEFWIGLVSQHPSQRFAIHTNKVVFFLSWEHSSHQCVSNNTQNAITNGFTDGLLVIKWSCHNYCQSTFPQHQSQTFVIHTNYLDYFPLFRTFLSPMWSNSSINAITNRFTDGLLLIQWRCQDYCLGTFFVKGAKDSFLWLSRGSRFNGEDHILFCNYSPPPSYKVRDWFN